MLMLFADENARCDESCGSRNAALTMRWQSSNVPATAKSVTLSPQQDSCCACRGDTRFFGYSSTTSAHDRRWNAAATAPPVSPDVATSTVSGREECAQRRASEAARKRAPKSLNAQVGP